MGKLPSRRYRKLVHVARSLLIVDWLVKVRSANSSSSMPHLKRARVMMSCFFNGMAKTFLSPPRDRFHWSSGNCLTVASVSSLVSRYPHRTLQALTSGSQKRPFSSDGL